MTRDELIAMERCHVKAWPAFETQAIDGWLWRYSGGGSQRANSVSTVGFTGTDPAAALDRAEALYGAKGVVCRVQTYDFNDLDDLLRRRDYQESEATLTMIKRLEPHTPPIEAEQYDHATAEWQAVYLSAITENRRAVNTRILAAIPSPRAFFGCRRDGRLISTALSVIGFGCAVIECVATREDARRQGGAEAALLALEAWAATQAASLIGLQVVAKNVPAVALYERLGFTVAATNRFWVKG